MLQIFESHIHHNFPFLKENKLLIAVSGGIDSMVLLHLFYQLKYNVGIAHCNFKLRGEDSDYDELFVKEIGKQLQIPTHVIQFDTEEEASKRGVSIQMVARDLRYQWFYELLEAQGYSYIVTAHQKDDVFETFFLNAIRGTGITGLTGIPAINGKIVRPLLPFSREEVEKYAMENKLQWREDKSNASVKYSRNKIRHQILPILREINPGFDTTFQKTIQNLKETKYIVDIAVNDIKDKVVSKYENQYVISISELQKLENPKPYLFELLKSFAFTEWSDVSHILEAQTGKQLLSATHRLLKNRDTLLITPRHILDKKQYFIEKDTKKITTPIPMSFEYKALVKNPKSNETPFSEWLVDTEAMLFDAEKLQFPLTLRRWKEGDWFYPIGLKGKKKVSKYFKDEKFSQYEKEKTWLLCSATEIVWIVGHRMDDRYKVNDNTTMIYKVFLEDK